MAIFSINSGSFGDVQVTGLVSASTIKGDGSQITSVGFDNIANKPTLISSSTQVTAALPTGTFSSSAQVTYSGISNIPADIVSSSGQVTAFLPTGTVSQSSQVVVQNTTGIEAIATTGSNTFTANQTISGSVTVTQNFTVLGSASIQYVSQSTLNIGTNLITVNTQTPAVTLGGLAVIDSGSSPQRSGSLLFDSVNDQWIFVHQNTAGGVTSSVLVMGPATFNNVGNETLLTQNQLLKGNGLEHITSSIITDTGTNIGIGTTTPSYLLDVQKSSAGSVVDFRIANTNNANAASGTRNITSVAGSSAGDPLLLLNILAVQDWHIGVDNSDSDKFMIGTGGTVGSENVLTATVGGNLGIGTTSPGYKLDINTVGGSAATTRLYGNDQSNVRLRLENVGSGGRTWELVGGLPGANNSNFSLYDVTGTATRLTVDSSGNLAVDTNVLYVDAANNSVGIGTATPGTTYQLTVRRDGADTGLRIGNNTTYDQFIYFNGNNDWSIGMDYSNSNAFVISNNSSLGTNDRVVLTTSGNLGLGVTPSAWGTTNTSILQVKNVSFGGLATNDLHATSNAYWDGSVWKYIASSVAVSNYYQNAGAHVWRTAASGTAGNTITWTTPMTLGADTYLTLNGASNDGRVQFSNTARSTSDGLWVGVDSAQSYILSRGSYPLTFYTSATERMRIDSSGNVGIGTTSPGAIVDIRRSVSGGVGPTLSLINSAAVANGNAVDINMAGNPGGGALAPTGRIRLTEDASANATISFWTYSASTGVLAQRVGIDSTGHVLPGANGIQDLGSSSFRWSTVYTSDLSLSNGIGDWTIVEGEDDLFIYNNKNNKVYKFTLQEIDPTTATPKKS